MDQDKDQPRKYTKQKCETHEKPLLLEIPPSSTQWRDSAPGYSHLARTNSMMSSRTEKPCLSYNGRLRSVGHRITACTSLVSHHLIAAVSSCAPTPRLRAVDST